MRTKILKLDDKVTVERNCEENNKSMKIFPRPKMYKNVSILSIVEGLEENSMTVGDEELKVLNCMTEVDENIVSDMENN